MLHRQKCHCFSLFVLFHKWYTIPPCRRNLDFGSPHWLALIWSYALMYRALMNCIIRKKIILWMFLFTSVRLWWLGMYRWHKCLVQGLFPYTSPTVDPEQHFLHPTCHLSNIQTLLCWGCCLLLYFNLLNSKLQDFFMRFNGRGWSSIWGTYCGPHTRTKQCANLTVWRSKMLHILDILLHKFQLV